MEKIKIKLDSPARTVCEMVRITAEAQIVLANLINEHNISARQLVSQMIIKCAPHLEFEKE